MSSRTPGCSHGSAPSGGEMPDWSRLPSDLLGAVARKITAIDDYVRFRAVCSAWRCAAPARTRHLPTQLPWLILPYRVDDDGAGEIDLYSVARRDFLSLPGPGRVQFYGSSRGWLLMGEEKGPEVSLLNPVTGASVRLPPLSTLPDMVVCERSATGEYVRRNMYESYIRKIVLSSDPAIDEDAVVMAIHGISWWLAFCRVGEDSWRSVEVPRLWGAIGDVAYHRGQFCVVFTNGKVAICDQGPPASIKPLEGIRGPRCLDEADVEYLVESTNGDLLLVYHFKTGNLCDLDGAFTLSFTRRFEVFKLELNDQPKASKLKSIGDNVLFLNRSSAICISAAGFNGFQGDCIYVADSNFVPPDDEDDDDATVDALPPKKEEDDDDFDDYAVKSDEDDDEDDGYKADGFRRHDIFMFNLKDGQKKLLRCYLYGSSPGWLLPMWYTPNLCQ